MNLTYQAIDSAGKRVQDVIEASDVREALEQLRRKGLLVTHIAAAEARQRLDRRPAAAAAGTRLSLKTLVFFTKQMTMLLKAGSAVVPALTAVRRQLRKPAQVALVNALIADLEEGSSLADALGKHPRTFAPTYRAIVAAGEASATLPRMFERLTGLLARRRAVRNKIWGAMAYPAFLVFLSINVLSTMLLFVIPRFSVLFTTLQLELPRSTAVMLKLSAWLQSDWPILVAVAAAGAAGLLVLFTSAQGRRLMADVQTEVPLIGRLWSRLIQGQLFQTLGMLIECRVGLLDALALGRGVTTNRRFQTLMDDIEQAVTSGDRISSALKRAGFISPSIYHTVHTGEENGNLGAAITFCAETLDEENAEIISTITRLIEPMILIVMGVLVGTVAVSLFMPLFDMTSAIG